LVRSVQGVPEAKLAVMGRGRVAVAAAFAVLVVALIMPWDDSIRRSAALEHAHVTPVSASAPGILSEIIVREGDKVEEGQLLAKLSNPDLEMHLASLLFDRQALEVRSRALAADSSPEAHLAQPVAARQVREVTAEIHAVEEKIASLELRSPGAGVVRTHRPEQLAGRLFRAGQPVLEVGVEGSARLLIALDEQQARKVRPGQSVVARFSARSGKTFEGEITRVPVSPAPVFSAPGLSNLLGGDVPSAASEPGRPPRPSLAYYEAEAVLEIPPEELALLRVQSAARARIHIRRTTLAGWLRDKVFDMVNPEIRL
jgi:multidrug resistance efflux pump